MLTIRLFGGLVLERDGQALPPPTPQKAALLLAYLLAAHNRVHPRALLAGLFWGDQPEQRARRNLSDALWRIRTLLEPRSARPDSGPPILLLEGDTVRYNPAAAVALDVRTFEELLRDPPDVERQARAVALYHGDLLAGYYDDWVLLERERLRQLYLAGLARLLTAYQAAGAWDAAVTTAARLVAADPYQESATRELMRLYYRLGRRDRAFQQFATLKAVLAADLEIEPEPETVALHALMQAGLAPPAGRAAPGPAGPALGDNIRQLSLIGRDAERTRLGAWLAEPRPHPPMILLQGEAGAGKTRLAVDIAEEAYRHRMVVLWGHYHPLATPLPYAGLVEALRGGLRLAGAPALEPIWLSEVSRLIPEVAAGQPRLPPPISLPPDQERIRLWEALTRYLLALAATGPHLFVLEDVQWIDPVTLDLFQYALPRLRNSGVGSRLLATARSEDLVGAPALTGALRNLEAQGMLGVVPVERLSSAAIGQLVQEALGLARPAPRFSDHLWHETEGNPFFALETLRFWAERGAITRTAAGGWQPPAADYGPLPTPASVRRVLEQRLASLSPAARAVIEVGAVLGREVPERLLWRASGATPEAVLGPAEELLRHQLWVEDGDQQGYQFAHQKVREVAYQAISGPRRRHLHRLAATALEAERPSAVARLAHHWLAAGDPGRALPYLQQAAEQAAAAFAHEEALAFYNQAVAAVAQLPTIVAEDDLERVYAVVAGRATINSRLQRGGPAGADLDWLVELARNARQPGRVADALIRRSTHLISSAHYGAAQPDLDAALELARTAQDRPAMARILTQLTRLQMRLGDHAAAARAATAALQHYQEIGDQRGEVEVLNLLGSVHGQAGETDRAVAILEEALVKVRRIANAVDVEARVLNNLGIFVSTPAAAYQLFTQFFAIVQQTGSLALQETAHQNLAEICYRFGRYADAQNHLDQAYELATQAQNQHDLGMVLITRGQVRAALGDPAAAQADLQAAVAMLDALGARYVSMIALLALGDFLLDQGLFAAGLGAVDRSYALWQQLDRPDGPPAAALYDAQKARGHAGLRRAGTARRAVAAARQTLAAAGAPGPQSWTDPSVEVCAHCYSVLTALGRTAEASVVLHEGVARMHALADAAGEGLRTPYLENVRECRMLRGAWEARAGDPASLRPEPADAAPQVERKVATRRAEIALMLRDAAQTGRALDEADLARSLGVSLRTIQRDLAALTLPS
ncbi:MAG TPA: AAA family ATPase, partial [Chloroflexia bacterium]|nr:AAA family ATPase [Chloroflexia bacterium]